LSGSRPEILVKEIIMRRTVLPLALALSLTAGSAAVSAEEAGIRATPAQAMAPMAPRADGGWTAGKVVALGIGAVAGVMVANATLPIAWGMATPIVGAVVGGTLGSWVHTRATEPAPMLRTKASMSAEAPSLFQMASFVTVE
jgi:hypothetical protein